MKQILFDRSGSVHVDEVPAPLVAPGRVLIRVVHSVISTGTETVEYGRGGVASQVANDPQLTSKVWGRVREVGIRNAVGQVRERLNERTPRGYSGSGIVLSVGQGVGDLEPGDRVAYGGEPHAEIVCAKRQLVARVPDGVALEQAAVTTLASIALHGLRLAEVSLGETIVVVGLGLVGQLTVVLGKAMGLRVVGADLIPHRVDLAKQFGLQYDIDPRDPAEATRRVQALSDGIGADAVIVCAGSESSAPTQLALELARDRGHVIVVGASGLSLERPPLFRKELVFRVSRSYGPGRYDPTYEDEGRDYPVGFVRWTENRNFGAYLSLLGSGAIDVTPLLSTRFPVERAAEAYAALKAGEDAPLTAVLDYDISELELDSAPVCRVALRESVSPGKNELRIGLIGCGAFARSQILPALRNLRGLQIHAVAAATGVSATNVGRLVDAAYSTTDFEQILADSDVDAVVIATRHDLHYPIALAAAEAGKPFHVEKPLAIRCEEAREIVAAVADSGIPACVGFNRRSAPFVQLLMSWLEKRSGPVDILIRVNAGALPGGHWALDPDEGGGRLVGEGCHFLDLASFLAGSPGSVVAASSTGLHSVGDIESNLTIVMNFPDGSRATVCYGSLGHRELPKERVEVSWDGRSVVIDDFKKLECHGVGSDRKVRVQDKGITAHFQNFVSALRGEVDLVAPVTVGLDVAERIEEARALLTQGV